MILLSYGTRPEWIKLKPVIDMFNDKGIEYKTLFSGQHVDLLPKEVIETSGGYGPYVPDVVTDVGALSDSVKEKLLSGMDDIAESLSHLDSINKFEETHNVQFQQ